MGDEVDETVEVPEVYLETISIHGREYQKYAIDNNIHFSPVDEEEGERLAYQHSVFKIIFEGRLLFPPIPSPEKILDCGYGPATWAIDVAERFPDCEVTGVDISPHLKPDGIPANFWPELDNLNEQFTFSRNTFDLVHSRLVASGVNSSRWSSYMQDIKRVLKPGGWVQMVECYYMCQSDNGSIGEGHALRQWSNKYFEALSGLKDLRAPNRLMSLLTAAGFTELEQNVTQFPLCGWPADARLKEAGEVNEENVKDMLRSAALVPFTQKLGMSIEAMDELVEGAARDASNKALKPYFPLYICIGRKPGP